MFLSSLCRILMFSGQWLSFFLPSMVHIRPIEAVDVTSRMGPSSGEDQHGRVAL